MDDYENPRAAFGLTRAGLSNDPKCAHVVFEWHGRELLGEVVRALKRGRVWYLHVKYMNGEAWPIEPPLLAVKVLRRTFDD